jgi:hypothetical protein
MGKSYPVKTLTFTLGKITEVRKIGFDLDKKITLNYGIHLSISAPVSNG